MNFATLASWLTLSIGAGGLLLRAVIWALPRLARGPLLVLAVVVPLSWLAAAPWKAQRTGDEPSYLHMAWNLFETGQPLATAERTATINRL